MKHGKPQANHRKCLNFIALIARMQTEEEFKEGEIPPSEDWICTLSELIVEARKLLRPAKRK